MQQRDVRVERLGARGVRGGTVAAPPRAATVTYGVTRAALPGPGRPGLGLWLGWPRWPDWGKARLPGKRRLRFPAAKQPHAVPRSQPVRPTGVRGVRQTF